MSIDDQIEQFFRMERQATTKVERHIARKYRKDAQQSRLRGSSNTSTGAKSLNGATHKGTQPTKSDVN